MPLFPPKPQQVVIQRNPTGYWGDNRKDTVCGFGVQS